jgi:hypothetical protein
MTNPWIEDSDLPPEEQQELNKRGAAARSRTGVGRSENVFEQKQLPEGKKNRVVFRLLTARFGESYRHWYTLPDGNKTADNCCCTPDERANRLAKCPVCQYMEAGMGNPGQGLGYDNTAHNYYLLCLFGERKTVHVRDQTTGQVRAEEEGIVWDPEPKIFKVGGMIFDELWKWKGNPDYPVGAGGDLTATNWSVWKDLQKNRTLYPVEPYNVSPRPQYGTDAEGNAVEIDIGTAAILRDQIIKECEPSMPEQLMTKLAMEPEQVPPSQQQRRMHPAQHQTGPIPAQQPQQQSVPTPVPAQQPVDQPATPVANDYEMEAPAQPVQQPQPQPVQPVQQPQPQQPQTPPPAATRKVNPEDSF